MEIDYSAIPEVAPAKPHKWVAPRHVYFGPKDADGTPMPEPDYVPQYFPSIRYGMQDGKIKAVQVNTKEEAEAYEGKGYTDTPASFGLETAPSFAAQKIIEPKRGPGRPPKVD